MRKYRVPADRLDGLPSSDRGLTAGEAAARRERFGRNDACRGAVTVLTVVRDLKAILEGTYLPLQLERMIGEAQSALAQVVLEHGRSWLRTDRRCATI